MSNLRKKEYLIQMVHNDPAALITEVNAIFAQFMVGIPSDRDLSSPFSKEMLLGPINRFSYGFMGTNDPKRFERPNYFPAYARALNDVRDVFAIPVNDDDIFLIGDTEHNNTGFQIQRLQEHISEILLEMLGRGDFEPLFVYANALQLDPNAEPQITQDAQLQISQRLAYFLCEKATDRSNDPKCDLPYAQVLDNRGDAPEILGYMQALKQR